MYMYISCVLIKQVWQIYMFTNKNKFTGKVPCYLLKVHTAHFLQHFPYPHAHFLKIHELWP